jgi:hypothetical protein
MKRPHLDRVLSRLNSFARREYLVMALKGFFTFLSLTVLLYLAVNLVELIGRFDTTGRQIIFFSFTAISALLCVYYVLIPLVKTIPFFLKPDHNELSRRIGENFPHIKDDLANAIQLITDNKKVHSESLVEAAFERIYKRSESIEFTELVDQRPASKSRNYSAMILGIVLIIFFISPGFRETSFRILHYDKDFSKPKKFEFFVDPGNATITRGDDLEIKIHAVGDAPQVITFSKKTVEHPTFKKHEIFPDSNGIFKMKFLNIKGPFEYYADAEDIESPVYSVKVINPPIITGFEIKVISPSYSGVTSMVQKDNGNISALKGSRVLFDLTSSKELDKAELVFSDSSRNPLKIDQNSSSGRFNVIKDMEYRILILDKEGNTNLNPIAYTIKTMTDAYPEIEIISPGKNIKLNDDNRVSLISKISDDFGFSKLLLKYRLSFSNFSGVDEDYSSIEIPIDKSVKEDDIYYLWDLNNLVLATEDVVSYYLEIYDNDIVSGPKFSKSGLFMLRVPSIDELFKEADEIQADAEKDLIETFKKAEELNKELEKISDELKQNNREITWEEKERIEKAIEEYKQLEQNVSEISQSLREMQQELQENNLLSEETLQKYMELQELMDELAGEEMREAFEKLQEMLKQMSRNQVQESFENFKLNEEAFKKSLERTVNLLKRLQIEQKIDEIYKRAEDLFNRQEELAKETEESDLNSNEESENLSDRQNEITKDLEKFQEELKNLQDKMSEFDDMPNEEMDQTADEFEKQKNKELSKESRSQLEQKQAMKAMEKMKQLSMNMQQMMDQMQNLQSQMMMQSQMQVMNDMMKILDNILTLSKEQEKLNEETKSLSPSSPQYLEQAQKQNKIRENLGRLFQQMDELSQKTFAISPEMGKALGEANAQMNQAINSLQNRSGTPSLQSQNMAMMHLNEAASMLQNSMQQMMQGGSGGGMMSMMQQLQQMAQQQMQLNSLTRMLEQQGRMSQQELAQLQRLAQEQELIRKSLDQLNQESKEAGQSKKLTSNLEKILEDMQEVISGMNTQKLDDELVQKQERILSKLLDAQRSLNEKDFEENRESESGDVFVRESPPELIFSTEEGKNILRDELLKASKEGYLKDYEDLIRRYFEALQKQEEKGN